MTKIKQQKQIRAFLAEAFGDSTGNALFGRQERILTALIDSIRNKSKNQQKTLVQTILPRIALYQAMQQDNRVENASEQMQHYMLDIVAAEKHSFTAKLEVIPGFYRLYSWIFLKIMRKSDLWESTQRHDRDSFDVAITKCLWHTACVENGCAELCSLFCDVDDVTYGGLRKMGFIRTKTLGYGKDCCDFHFFKK